MRSCCAGHMTASTGIVVNGYYRQAHSPGGFRIWWRRLHGGEDTLDNAHLIRMAGRFRRRLRAWAAENRVPVRICNHGEQKHDVAEEYRHRTEIREGLFLIIEGRAQAPVWRISRTDSSVERSPYPYVNTSPSIFWTTTGDTSRSRSAVIRHSRLRSFSTVTDTWNARP